ncbi:hypothetical protein TNCV_3690751 [Trichonephila clavipes]|nr:hypothetical protein TNCV_3690751 [Trichonephila clavipes]
MVVPDLFFITSATKDTSPIPQASANLFTQVFSHCLPLNWDFQSMDVSNTANVELSSTRTANIDFSSRLYSILYRNSSFFIGSREEVIRYKRRKELEAMVGDRRKTKDRGLGSEQTFAPIVWRPYVPLPLRRIEV